MGWRKSKQGVVQKGSSTGPGPHGPVQQLDHCGRGLAGKGGLRSEGLQI